MVDRDGPLERLWLAGRDTARSFAYHLPPLRRLVDHRDQLLVEKARLEEQNAALERTVAHLDAELDRREVNPHRWVRHHDFRHLDEPVGYARVDRVATGDEDRALIERIIDAYAHSVEDDHCGQGSEWRAIGDRKWDLHEALVGRDVEALTTMLREPMSNYLLLGYERFERSRRTYEETSWRQNHAVRCKDLVVRFAEALGVMRLENPEGGTWGQTIHTPTDVVVARVQDALGFELAITTVQRGFDGLSFGDGIVTERMIHAAYYAWRAAQLLDRPSDARVLEIGAGIGYSACYARRIGVRDYTIVDLPMTNVAQAYFLGRALGDDCVSLVGEPEADERRQAPVKIRTPTFMDETCGPFELGVSMDALTEFGLPSATEYARRIAELTPQFLSINHEANEYTLHELFESSCRHIERRPYWLRFGYVEEVVRF